MSYPLNISIVSTLNDPCPQMSIQSSGESTYDGWYEQWIFGSYRFASIDARGNHIYYANILGEDTFICKDMENDWVVRSVPL